MASEPPVAAPANDSGGELQRERVEATDVAAPVAAPARRRIIVTHTRCLTFNQVEVDAVWNSGALPIPDYILSGDEYDEPDDRAIAVFTALDGSLLELFVPQEDDDVGYEVEDYDPEA